MNNAKKLIQRTLRQVDDLVVVFEYLDAKGEMTRRVVSPIRMLGETHFLGLCLSREEPRQFVLDRCRNLRIDLATRYVMPVPLTQVVAA